MRDEFFKYYVALGHSVCYYREYYIHTRRINNIISGFLLLTSAASVVTWSFWKQYPLVWTIIIVLAQVVQILQPLMQSSKQHEALKYIIQDTAVLFDDVCDVWETNFLYETPNNSAAVPSLRELKQRERASKTRYAPEIDFPFKKRLDKRAQKTNTRYFWYHYQVKPEEFLS